MALIKCNECGKEISDRAKVCPHCGFENRITFCPECNKKLSSNVSVCPHCGCPIKKNKNIGSEEKNTFCLSGMIIGIVSFFIDFFGLVSAVGLTLSIIGYTKTTDSNNKKLEIIGIICSGIELVVKFIQLTNLISIGY